MHELAQAAFLAVEFSENLIDAGSVLQSYSFRFAYALRRINEEASK